MFFGRLNVQLSLISTALDLPRADNSGQASQNWNMPYPECIIEDEAIFSQALHSAPVCGVALFYDAQLAAHSPNEFG